MNRDTLRQWIVVLAVLAALVLNGLANALPLNGLNTGEISDRFRVYFVPAGYVFAIWGVVYLGWLALTGYQLLPAQRENPRLRRIGYWFALSCVANPSWLFLWHYEQFVLTVPVMLLLLVSLIVIYSRLGIGRPRASAGETWCVRLPVSIYLGWITVATIANVTSTLDYLRWGGWGIDPQVWAVILLAAGVGIATAVSLTRRDVAYLLVLVWAFAGVAVKQAAVPLVAVSAWIAAGLVALALVVGLLAGRRRSRPE